MTWTNVFSIGECDVDVYRYGTLIPPAEYADYNFTLTTTDGVVTLEGYGYDPGDPYGLDGVRVLVRPLFDPESRPVRVARVAAEGITRPYSADLMPADEQIELRLGIDSYSPDPAEFISPELVSWEAAGVQMYSGS